MSCCNQMLSRSADFSPLALPQAESFALKPAPQPARQRPGLCQSAGAFAMASAPARAAEKRRNTAALQDAHAPIFAYALLENQPGRAAGNRPPIHRWVGWANAASPARDGRTSANPPRLCVSAVPDGTGGRTTPDSSVESLGYSLSPCRAGFDLQASAFSKRRGRRGNAERPIPFVPLRPPRLCVDHSFGLRLCFGFRFSDFGLPSPSP